MNVLPSPYGTIRPEADPTMAYAAAIPSYGIPCPVMPVPSTAANTYKPGMSSITNHFLF